LTRSLPASVNEKKHVSTGKKTFFHKETGFIGANYLCP